MLSQFSNSTALVRVQSWSRDTPPPAPIGRLLGLDWPLQVGEVAQGQADVDVICIGPTDWLVLSQAEVDPNRLVQAIEETLQESCFRATDVSSALVRIRINGAAARALLAKACALDVSSPSLAPGRASRTLVAGLAVVLRCLEPTVFECIAPRSYSDYLLSWLADAGAEFNTTASAHDSRSERVRG
jgi:heterotetrameric sarcosine oxidase gamma subunit